MSLLHGVTTLQTHWRLAATGLALVLATGAAFAADAPLPASGDALTPSTTAPPATDERSLAHAEFKRLFEAGEYSAAVEQGRRVVELTERAGARSEELQVALMNLALAQLRAGDYVAAEASFQRVIGLVEASGRLTSPRLARAYAGLGLTYHAARRYDLAAVSLDRAISLNRRAEGLFNEEQLPLLEKQADALTELDRPDDALQTHRYALRLVGRRFGEQSLRYAKQLESFGRWYTRAGAYESARVVLRDALDLVVQIKGADSLELIGPLTAAADNSRRWLMDPDASFESLPDDQRRILYHDPVLPSPPSLAPSMIASEGLRALERATAIVDAHPDAPPSSVAVVHAQLGDLFQIRQAPDAALPHYLRAWQAASRAPPQDGRRLEQLLFDEPVLLQYVLPDGWDRYAARPPAEVERRLVEIEATVTPQGQLQDLKLVSDAGDAKFAQRALRAAETARYRPRLADGQPVATTGVRFTQPLYVLREGAEPADTAVKPDSPPPADKPQGGG